MLLRVLWFSTLLTSSGLLYLVTLALAECLGVDGGGRWKRVCMSEIDEGGDRAELVARKSFLSGRLYSLFTVVLMGV